MKRFFSAALAAALLLLPAGCGGQAQAPGTGPAPSAGESASSQAASSSAGAQAGEAQGEISGEDAFAIALANAGVPEADARNVKIEEDGDGGIPIYDIEFETDYGDYDFEVAIRSGEIVGADYEVDEEWLDALDGSPVTADEARALVQEKVPGAPLEDIRVWEEGGDGRGRYEGELFFGGMKYEFELDPRTGVIFDWTADLRE